ncbi:MAG: CYTH domain-containing protein [Candidatus Microsaccharimonas sp.]
MNTEKIINKVEFEQNSYREIERKFVPKNAELFEQWKSQAVDIAQLYLSNSEDEYSLRLRQVVDLEGNEKYTATVKDRGVVSGKGLERMEVETLISKDAFLRYAQSEKYPILFKKRATICEGVTVDWIEGSDTPLVEVENGDILPDASLFLSNFESELIERTGNSDVDNESLAHLLSERKNEREKPLSVEEILRDILAYRSIGVQKLVIGMGGRSGSGKSTLARELALHIQNHPQLGEVPALISTDDYHVGRAYLENTYGAPWTNWEDARVYDTAEAGEDVKRLLSGESIQKRHFDFKQEEVVFESPIEPADIVIVEGIHAASHDLDNLRTMFFEVNTPVSTALGRDLKRLMTTDRPSDSIATPEARLRYIIEIGEPTYLTIEPAKRNVFSASVRPLVGKGALKATIQ